MELGQVVKDIVTGLEGVAIGKADFIEGHSALLVQPKARDGELPAPQWIDVLRLSVVEDAEGVKTVTDPAHRRFQFKPRAREVIEDEKIERVRG